MRFSRRKRGVGRALAYAKGKKKGAREHVGRVPEMGAIPVRRGSAVPADKLFREWRKDPKYVAAYNRLDDAFALAAAMMKARTDVGFTQRQLAKRMRTTPAVIAGLESGWVNPSTRTLQRVAEATGMRLRISFEAASS